MQDNLRLLERIQKDFDSDIVAFTRSDKKNGYFSHQIVSVFSSDCEFFETPFAPLTYCAAVLAANGPLVIESHRELESGVVSPLMNAEALEAYLGVAVSVSQRKIGALEIFCREPRSWQPEEVLLLQKYASIIEAVIEEQENPKNVVSMFGQSST